MVCLNKKTRWGSLARTGSKQYFRVPNLSSSNVFLKNLLAFGGLLAALRKKGERK